MLEDCNDVGFSQYLSDFSKPTLRVARCGWVCVFFKGDEAPEVSCTADCFWLILKYQIIASCKCLFVFNLYICFKVILEKRCIFVGFINSRIFHRYLLSGDLGGT